MSETGESLQSYINALHALELLTILKHMRNQKIDYQYKETLNTVSSNLLSLSYKCSNISLNGNIKLLLEKFLNDQLLYYSTIGIDKNQEDEDDKEDINEEELSNDIDKECVIDNSVPLPQVPLSSPELPQVPVSCSSSFNNWDNIYNKNNLCTSYTISNSKNYLNNYITSTSSKYDTTSNNSPTDNPAPFVHYGGCYNENTDLDDGLDESSSNVSNISMDSNTTLQLYKETSSVQVEKDGGKSYITRSGRKCKQVKYS